jgi:putative endonuclease
MAKEHKYWVYIMASLSGTLYIGVTGKLFVRVAQHKSGEVEGFSRQYNCTRLVYYEIFDGVKKTIARETQSKGWRRSKKIALIEKMNPRWQDLAEHWGEKLLFQGQSMEETPRRGNSN